MSGPVSGTPTAGRLVTSGMRPLVVLSALTAVAALTAACTTDPRPDPPRVALTAPAGQVVFRVAGSGGMAPADYGSSRRPGLTIYGNGDVYVLAPDTSRADTGPLALRRGHLGRGALAELVTLAGRSGLFGATPADFGEPSVTDLDSTVVTFRPGRTPARTASAYALNWTRGEQSLGLVERSNRAGLRTLLDRLFDAVPSTSPWLPSRIQVSESYDRADGRSVTWPGPAFATLLTATNETGRPCGVIAGPLAGRIHTLARSTGTADWHDPTGARKLVIVDLLPDERGC